MLFRSLTARSGRHALKHHLVRLGFEFNQEEIDKLYIKFLKLADSKKNLSDDDIVLLAGGEQSSNERKIELKHLQVLSGTIIPSATVTLLHSGKELTYSDTGNGPIDAAINAIKQSLKRSVTLQEFLIQSMSKGSNDVGRVHMQIQSGDTVVHGFGANTDIVSASVEAFIDGVNKLI